MTDLFSLVPIPSSTPEDSLVTLKYRTVRQTQLDYEDIRDRFYEQIEENKKIQGEIQDALEQCISYMPDDRLTLAMLHSDSGRLRWHAKNELLLRKANKKKEEEQNVRMGQ